MTYLDEAQKRVTRIIGAIETNRKIPASNKELVRKYVAFMEARGLNPRTVNKNLYCIAVYLRALGHVDILTASRDDIEKAMAQIEHTKYSAFTKQHIKISIKSVYKHFLGEDLYYPKQIAWIKSGMAGRTKKLLPEDILSEDEIIRMLNATASIRNKAIIALLFDSGMRMGELMQMKIKDVDLVNQPAHVVVDGKTGMRKIPIMFSVPYLAQLLNSKTDKKPSSYLWMAEGSWAAHDIRSDYSGIRLMLKSIGKKAGITKRIYPHLFRHSRASYYANRLTEQQLKAFFGWSGDSRMASTYVHLSGRDIDNAILQANGQKPVDNMTEPKLKTKVCSKCRFDNTLDSTYCNRCGAPLDISTAMNAQEAEDRLKSMSAEMMKDPKIVEDIVHAYLLMQAKKGRKA